MNVVMPERETPDFQDVCNIVVLYDNDATRTRALAACDYLVRQFWQEVELKFHWWRTDFLADAQLARVAADNAVTADFLIISSENDLAFSPRLESWFESWLARRAGVQGALVDLLPPSSQPTRRDSPRERFLMDVGRHGGFDYLTSIPGGAGESTRNDTRPPLAGTIDDILGESRPPTHYGLNE